MKVRCSAIMLTAGVPTGQPGGGTTPDTFRVDFQPVVEDGGILVAGPTTLQLAVGDAASYEVGTTYDLELTPVEAAG